MTRFQPNKERREKKKEILQRKRNTKNDVVCALSEASKCT
jgi:hypothetical protein